MEQVGGLFNIDSSNIRNYITGRRLSVMNMEVVKSLEDLVTTLEKTLRKSQSKLLKQLYNDFYADNARVFPGVHKVHLQSPSPVISISHDIGYPSDWKNPNVVAKHFVELLIRQGSLMPAGRYGEGAEYYDVLNRKSRHHIDFYKASKDVKNLILLGNLHFKFTRLEPVKDLDYYSRMRYMRNCFEGAIPPSFWEKDLQDLYIKNLKEIVTSWEVTRNIFIANSDGKKIDFLKVNIRGNVHDLQSMIREGWITEEWVDNIIQDLRQKLESRSLL